MRKVPSSVFLIGVSTSFDQDVIGRCLTTLFHIKDDQCRPPPWSRLGIGTVRVQTVANFDQVLIWVGVSIFYWICSSSSVLGAMYLQLQVLYLNLAFQLRGHVLLLTFHLFVCSGSS